MKISEKNGIVKWENEQFAPSGIPLSKALFINPDWYYIYGEWFHIVGSLNDKELYDDIYVNGKQVGPESVKLINHLLPMMKKINLLPKESTMRTRYAVVNLREKVEFEKKWEMPYGYNNCPHIGFTQKEAIEWVNRNLGPNEKKDYVVERHTAGKVDVVWKIDSLIGLQEEDENDEEF